MIAATLTAHAAELQGTVTSIDLDANTIVLEDGTTLTVAEDVDMSEVQEGDAVFITTDDSTGDVVDIMVSE